MFSVLYEAKGEIFKIGPYDLSAEADDAARRAQRDGVFDIHDQNVYLLRPDHTFVAYSMDELTDTHKILNSRVSCCIVSGSRLIELAGGLKSEHGENPEYDRALVELVTDALSLSMDYKDAVARLIGIKQGASSDA